MLKRIFLLLLISTSVTGVVCAQRYGQHIDVSVNVGYATFNQHSLKKFQQEQLHYAQMPGEVTRSFPGNVNYSIDAVFFDSSYFMGVMIGHTYTTGRVQCADNSGSITTDQRVKMNYVGLVIGKRIRATKYGDIFLGTDFLPYFNKVDLSYTETIWDNKTSYSADLKSINFALGAFIMIQKRIGPFFLKGSGGYEFHFATDLYWRKPGEPYKVQSGETIKVNANGFRFNVGIGYTVYTRKDKRKK